MLKHYFLLSIRSILKDKAFSILNVLGLTLALACCLFLIFWIDSELSYEKEFPKVDKIYQVLKVEQREAGPFWMQTIRPGISVMLKKTFPEIDAATFVDRYEGYFTKEKETEETGIKAKMISTSIDFLRMFSYHYIEGSPQSLIEAGGCIITDEAARRIFGAESPMNKTIYFGSYASFQILAVVKKPEKTHLDFDMLNLSREPYFTFGAHYIMLKENARANDVFKEKLSSFLIEHRENTTDKLDILPLRDTHLWMPTEAKDSSYGNFYLVVLYSIATLLILTIAVISYVNTSIARSMNRLKEIGVLKVAGADQLQLVKRFLLESCILTFVATIFALVLVKLLYPYFSQMMGQEIVLEITDKVVILSLLMGFLVGILSGVYSAFYLSSLGVVNVLRGGTDTGSQGNIRKVLIGVQVFLSLSIILCTTLIYRQIKLMYNLEGGINKENIIILKTNLWYQSQAFIDHIVNENPNILSASMASVPPYNAPWSSSGAEWDGSDESTKKLGITHIYCDHQYADVFGLQLAMGDFLDPTPTGDNPHWFNESSDVVINETLWKTMGVDNPIGMWIKYGPENFKATGEIRGVIKDFNFKPLNEPVSPVIFSLAKEATTKLYIKTTGDKPKETLDYILTTYEEMKSGIFNAPTIYGFIKEDYDVMYASELKTADILTIFTLISLLLSLFGIVSMVSFMIEKRSKEIAIRRINGAKVKDIVSIFVKEMLLICLVASAIAIPVCYILVKQWQQTYIFQASLAWWIFLGVALLVMFLIIIIVSLQVVYTAQLNPVNSLKKE